MYKDLILQITPTLILLLIAFIGNIIRKTFNNDVLYKQIIAFAQNTIKSILLQYPTFSLEEVVSKALYALEQKFGTDFLSIADFEIIIRGVLRDLNLSEAQLIPLVDKLTLDGVYSAQQNYLNQTIKAEDRKQHAVGVVTKGLQTVRINVNPNSDLAKLIDDKVEAAVYQEKLKLATVNKDNVIKLTNITK